MYYYAMSDIHGYLNILKENMKQIDLTDQKNKLIFLGDYIDYGPDSCETIYYIKELTQKYPNQVIALKGNHEESFIEWLSDPLPNISCLDLNTIKTFLTSSQFKEVNNKLSKNLYETNSLIADLINKEHKKLIKWIQNLPLYYQTERQIFVHAGINEEAEELWIYGTPDEYFTSKYPAETGYFLKDIIAGHIGTSEIKKDKLFHDIYWDGMNHYYIDGTVQESNYIPILKYDTITGIYTNVNKICKNKVINIL